MMIIQTKATLDSFKKNKVRLFLEDKITGEVLSNIYLPSFKPNSVSPLATEVAIRCLGGFIDQGAPNGPTSYAAARIEWGSGIGMTNAPMNATNPDLESAFSPRVFTDFNANPEYPGLGMARFLSYIDDSVVPLGTQIQEVGLRTLPLSGYPDGILIARFQNDSPLMVSNGRVRIGVEWIYVYQYV